MWIHISCTGNVTEACEVRERKKKLSKVILKLSQFLYFNVILPTANVATDASLKVKILQAREAKQILRLINNIYRSLLSYEILSLDYL